MNLDDYDLSYQKLHEAETIFKNLLKSKNIPLYNKDIIKIYEDISSVLSTFIKRIENLKKENKISQLNEEFSEQIKNIEFSPSSEDIKTERIRISLENLCFTDGGKLKQLRFELPANFCPLPPPIESIFITTMHSMNDFHPWNHNLEINTNFESLKLSKNYQQLEITQNFVEKDKIYRYIIDFEKNNLFDIINYKSVYEAGRNRFIIDIRSNGFDGERKIKFCLKQNDICIVGIDLELPVKHLEFVDNFTEYDIIKRNIDIMNRKTRLIWIEIYNFLDDFSLDYFPKEVYSIEPKFNKELCKILSPKFKNVELDKKISGRIHIDVSVDEKIAIEVKKMNSNTKRDEVFGQLFNDIRIGLCKFGIALGIDMTVTNKFKEFNRIRHEEGIDIIYIIKENPY